MSETPQPNPDHLQHPAIKEELKAQESLTPEQRELSAVRQIFMEREPRIADLPADFRADLNLSIIRGGYGPDYIGRKIIGTFDDRGTIEIGQRTPANSTNEEDLYSYGRIYEPSGREGRDPFKKKIGELTPEEAKELFEDLYPVAEAFSQLKSSENQIRTKYRNERNNQELREREDEQEKTLHIEKTKQEAFAEGKTIGRYEGILESKLDGIEISEEDKDFVYDAISKIAATAGSSDVSQLMSDPVSYPQTEEEKRHKQKHQEDYARRKNIITQLLGVSDGRVTWNNLGDFAGRYTESYTFSTIFPDLVLVLGDNDRSFGVASDSRYVEGHKKVIAERVAKALTPVS